LFKKNFFFSKKNHRLNIAINSTTHLHLVKKKAEKEKKISQPGMNHSIPIYVFVMKMRR